MCFNAYEKKKVYLKDFIIYAIILGLIVYIMYKDLRHVADNQFLSKLSTFIGSVTIILFGVIGIFEFAYDNGLNLIVPNSFINYKEDRAKKQMECYIEKYFKEELHIIKQYNNERVSFFLAQLGLSQHDFELIKEEIVSIKMMPLNNLQQAQEKMIKILKSGNIIFDQTESESKRLVYKKVRYFINFTDIMYVKDYSDELEDCLIMLLREILNMELNRINNIIIPSSSNRMLGFGIGQKLGKAIINVTKDSHIFEDQYWEGHFDSSKQNYGVVIHDVLVTGEQIVNSIKKIEKECVVNYVFCLIERTDHKGKKILEENGYKVYSLLQLSDSELKCFFKDEKQCFLKKIGLNFKKKSK